MREDFAITNLEKQLEILEDGSSKQLKAKSYNIFLNALKEVQNGVDIGSDMAKRLINVCLCDMRRQSNTFSALTMINAILTNINVKEDMVPELSNCLLENLNVIKTSTMLGNVQALQKLCFETITLYPDSVFAELENHPTVRLELLDNYPKQIVSLILKLLKSLSPSKRRDFVEKNLDFWFLKLIPAVFNNVNDNSHFLTISFETLEALTDELVNIDYANNKNWQQILDCICNQKKYPSVMSNMLKIADEDWYRLWIVCIKLLKNQITPSNSAQYGPRINSMLSVVQEAFKMKAASCRCKAFKCWEVLIDTLQEETSEVIVVKRLKLLIIPLLCDNAKVEETILAKFNTWWHLICKFENNLEKFLDTLLFSFLHFCFGEHSSRKQTLVPGLLTINTKKLCVEAFTEIAGHLKCDRCVTLERLNCRVLSNEVLVDHWTDWIHSLKTAITITCENTEMECSTQHIVCAWESFVFTVGELPDNGVRRDLFDELLILLEALLKQSEPDNNYAKVIFDLLMSVFRDKKNYALIKDNPLDKIRNLLLSPAFDLYFKTNDIKDTLTRMKPLAAYVIQSNPECFIRTLFRESLLASNNLVLLWIALTEAKLESKCDCIKSLQLLLLKPLKCNSFFTKENVSVKYSLLLWYKLFEIVYPKDVETVNRSLNNFVWYNNTVCINLKLFAAVGVLNYDIENHSEDFDKHIRILSTLTSIIDITVLDNLWTPIIDVLGKATKKILMAEKRAMILMQIINNILKLMNIAAVWVSVKKEMYVTNLLTILHCLDTFLQKKTLSPLIAIVLDELTNILVLSYTNKKTVENDILLILKNCLPNIMDLSLNQRILNAINKIECIDSTDIHAPNNTAINKFSTPNSKTITRRTKKTASPAEVSSAVYNGEEFIVVKSNWRFNPRKLTDNQKEKLQRKREDIPALYQDLSQSQDEFKLTSWKPELQDSSSTNSTTASHSATAITSKMEEVSNIFENIPSPNVVPKIINNILENNAKVSCSDKASHSDKDLKTISSNSISSPGLSNQTVNVKNVKSPRIALKDRVFKNVRNLIEISNTHNENDFSDSLNVDNTPKTPSSKSNDIPNLSNSAPPKISADRPPRVKRTPKKFSDSKIFLLKSRRHSIHNNHSQQETNMKTNDVLDKEISESSDFININAEKCVELPKTSGDANVYIEKLYERSNQLVTEEKRNTLLRKSIRNESSEVRLPRESEGIPVLENDATEVDNDKTCNIIPIEITREDTSITTENSEGLKCDSKTSKKQSATNQNPPLKKNKQNSSKRSRIEKELAIDTVEGHPLLKVQSEKRVTRKNITPLNNSRRKRLTAKLNKSKLEVKHKTLNSNSKTKDKDRTSNESTTDDNNCKNQLHKGNDLSEDLPLSEDIIESSQDSTLTTISGTSTKHILKKLSVLVEKTSEDIETKALYKSNESNKEPYTIKPSIHYDGQDDTQLPINKSVVNDKSDFDLTENMDTEPLISEIVDNSNEVMVINVDEESTSATAVGKDSQEIADADTQPTDFNEKINVSDKNDRTTTIVDDIGLETQEIASADTLQNDFSEEIIPSGAFRGLHVATLKNNIDTDHNVPNSKLIVDKSLINNTENELSKTIAEYLNVTRSKRETDYSPSQDDEQRKKDFLDNTIEISPIKIMSPVKEKISLSPETSSDYLVVKLSSPVQSNGEPFEKCDSPEIFTEEKVSPDKRDVSPPREEKLASNNNSPSSSLSLKKNRPQVRSGGRAAQMLGLCVPDRLHTISNVERSESEEPIRSNTSSTITPVRRNLRIFYNAVADSENCEESDDSENFLKFKRTLPNADSSPSVPILKRKLSEITDDTALSPASKRKRVSFNDPPVSTTISVQKYIEPCGVRSPQNSAVKRLERQNLRSQPSTLKSQKRLANVYNLDSVLTKTVESFTEIDLTASDDTQSMSLDETPAVEIVKTSDLNDTDPICSDLLDCNDSIDEIAADLSSPAMKVMFLKELKGTINTVGDLAKMTELEVNRLCIKAPKVNVAKKVLNDYVAKKSVPALQQNEVQEIDNKSSTESIHSGNIDIETQTENIMTNDMEVQTIPKILKIANVQTDKTELSAVSIQTDESGSKTTKEIITACVLQRPDFVDVLVEDLEESSKIKVAERLPFNTLNDILMKNLTNDNSRMILTKILEKQSVPNEGNKELLFLQKFLCDRFKSKDLVMFCSRLLAEIHDASS